jgi:GAF domain-containing protein/HAMP domain-containing protein
MSDEKITPQARPSFESLGPANTLHEDMPTPDVLYRSQLTQRGPDVEQRSRLAKRVILIGAAFGVLDILVYVFVFLQSREWQTLAAVAGIPVAMILLTIANRLINKQRITLAGYLMLAAVAIAFWGGELNTAGTAVINAVSGTLLIILVGAVVLPHRTFSWIIIAGMYLVGILLMNVLEPWPRYELIQQSPTMLTFVPAIALILTLVVLYQVVRAFRASTIQTRLLITFTTAALLLTIVISIVSAVVTYQTGRELSIAHLESVATLKEAEIEVWLQTLQTDLGAILADRLTDQLSRLVLDGYPEVWSFDYARNRLRDTFNEPVERTYRFEEVFLVNLRGNVIISTDTEQEGDNYLGWDFFQQGLEEPTTTVVLAWDQIWIAAAYPVTDIMGETRGLLVGRTTLKTLTEIMLERTGLGNTGETYLLTEVEGLLTEVRGPSNPPYVHTEGANYASEQHDGGSGIYENYDGETVVGVYRWLPGLDVVLMAEQHRSEALAATYQTLGINVGVALFAVVLAVVVSLFITRSIVNPLADLADTVERISAGDLYQVARVTREDEVGAVARAFNSLTKQLRELIGNLEDRVADRTAALERRSLQLEAAAQVARDAAGIRTIGELLNTTVHLISDQFGFYHAGIFLLDDRREYAVLQAASSEGGQRMLARRHSLKIGEVGIVGNVAATGEPRVALDVGADAVFFDNPDLPETRSEMGLPLIVREEIIGVLDVQSTEEAAFSGGDVAIMHTVADQIALAIDNAHLLEESQTALKELENLYGQRVRETWQERIRQYAPAYHYDRVKVTPSSEPSELIPPSSPELPEAVHDDNGHRLVSPVRLRGQVLGSIVLRRNPDQEPWSEDEIALVDEVSTQIALALENAQLLEETQRHSERDRLIAGITARVRSSMHMETILQTAVQELGAALGTSRAVVKLTGIPDIPTADEGSPAIEEQEPEDLT